MLDLDLKDGKSNVKSLARGSAASNDLCASALIHELQERLITIALVSGYCMAEEKNTDPTLFRRRIAQIAEAAAEMQRILTAVKHLRDDSPPERSVIDITSLAARIVRALVDQNPTFANALVRVESNMRVHANPEEIELLLTNLISNALKFSANQLRPEVRITSETFAGRTFVKVSDNGVGVAPEDAVRMFTLFARCHPGFAGSGVGLAIARRIVERHKGEISAAGEPGAGCTVSFGL